MTASKKRIGLLVPSSNSTIEVEFYRALPAEITLHVARCYLTRIEPASIARLVEDVEREASYLASADVDVIVLGATAPSFLRGKGYDQELIGRIGAASGGKPATTTSTALLAALKALGISRLALSTAFKAEVNDIAVKFLSDNEFNVVTSEGLGMVDNLEVGRLSPETAIDAARAVDSAEAEAIVLACTNWHSMAVLSDLEKELGKPVISTSQVSLWHSLGLLGHSGPIDGYGSLLADVTLRQKARG
jgi:maleate isomerase